MTAHFWQMLPEYDGHARVIPVVDDHQTCIGFIAIYNERPGFPSLGATRWWTYSSQEEACADALRLAKLMAYKAAGAELPYGGAKGVIFASSQGDSRAAVLKAYARAVEELSGVFVTGTDVGLSDDDLEIMKTVTRHIIGTGVPSGYYTALGVMFAMQETLQSLYQDPALTGRTIVIQGLGKTGLELARLARSAGARVVVTDINPLVVARARELMPELDLCQPGEEYTIACDVFAPCGVSGAITPANVDHIPFRSIVGAANNQLTDPRLAQTLHRRGIRYIPDYIVNAGGLLSVVDELQFGSYDATRVAASVDTLRARVRSLLEESARRQVPPLTVADERVRERLSLL